LRRNLGRLSLLNKKKNLGINLKNIEIDIFFTLQDHYNYSIFATIFLIQEFSFFVMRYFLGDTDWSYLYEVVSNKKG